jgi:RNA polymerase sigma factor (sigma-70 family)
MSEEHNLRHNLRHKPMTPSEKLIELPQRIDELCKEALQDAKELRDICEHATSTINPVHVQCSKENKVENNIVAFLTAKEKLVELEIRREQAANELREFIYANLSNNDASILDWRYCNCKACAEIAEILGISDSAVRSRVNRARRKLQTLCSEKQLL